MTFVTAEDGTNIFYKDWGPKDAQPIVFHHGWPLSADDWDTQMLFFLARATASSPMTAAVTAARARSDGHDMDHYAADARPWRSISTANAVHIGHSTGGGEVARYVARHRPAQGRVAKACWSARSRR